MRDDRLEGAAIEGWRTPAERDEDRLLYTSAFRRLIGVTQVVPSREPNIFHNRLTHSLKVGQVGKRSAAYLIKLTDPSHLAAGGGLDPTVLNVAGQAHDLGHPPFGHIAEIELRRILDGEPRSAAPQGSSYSSPRPKVLLKDGFEGNAQTFRIVAKLAARRHPATTGRITRYQGLGLTRATLAALLKYPWLRGGHPPESEYFKRKWGAYNSEAHELSWASQLIPPSHFRTLEADVMDWADDVTYAVHDIEDFFRVGIIPLHEIRAGAMAPSLTPVRVFDNFWSYATFNIEYKGEINFQPDLALSALREVSGDLPAAAYRDSDSDRLILHALASGLVKRFQQGMSVNSSGKLEIQPETKMLIEALKQLTWYFVIDQPALATLQQGQIRVIRDLFDWLLNWVRQSFAHQSPESLQIIELRKSHLPALLRDFVELAFNDSGCCEEYKSDEEKYTRGVVDFIASLTELQAYELHHRLGGSHEQPALGAWINR
jgi:dGTPase